jgi:peptidoglycan/LPS O-acetylase OafA/YrhL
MRQMDALSPPGTAREQRNASLDTLRGLAILFVLVGHYLKFAPHAFGGIPVGAWFTDFGQGGVILFFMLSGYLIWIKGQENPATVFLLRRFAKIVPAYWVNVAFVALAGLILSMFPAFGLRDTLGNLFFLGGSMGINALSGVYWTLIVEIKFYLLFALVFYSPLRRFLWWVPVAAVVFNLGLLMALQRSSVFLVYIPLFFIGAGIAAVEREKLSWPAFIGLAGIAIAGLAFTAPFRGLQAAVFLSFDLILFLAIWHWQIAQRHLARLGVISYSVYLYHTTLGYPLLEAFGPAFGNLWLLLAMAVLFLVAVVSWLSFQHVEVRFVRMARRLERSAVKVSSTR